MRETAQSPLLDVVIVGAGFGGLYALHRLRAAGFGAKVLEAGSDVGGTWYWNRYPGARCDVESLSYSYSFSEELQQEWHWRERYAPQSEILSYANHVADRFDLRRDIQFDTRVRQAVFDEAALQWRIRTDTGDEIRARYCIMATGCLSLPRRPEFDGLAGFEGDWYHTGNWPHEEVNFSGRRVGIIGTGSSAVQAIPVIASEAAHLTVFQRTANFSLPAWNQPMDPQTEAYWKAHYPELREAARRTGSGILNLDNENAAADLSAQERQAELDERWRRGGLVMWNAFADVLTSEATNRLVSDYVREKIRQRVGDREVAERLCPKDHPIGAKRLCADTHYYETYNRDNVTLVDVKTTPIEAITARGLRTTEAQYEFDTLVFATGFDAMTGPLLGIDIQGRHGNTLKQAWAGGPRTYLGLCMADFPNLFAVTGPGSPSVLTNMIPAIEQHVDWIAACLEYLRERGLTTIESTDEAQSGWVDHVNAVADATLYPRANSWYMGANIPGKPRVFMPYVGGFRAYQKKLDGVAVNDYEGFRLS